MRWSPEQLAQLTQEHLRLGGRSGEHWPEVKLAPATVLAVMRTVPDGAGCAGYLAALRRTPPVPWYKRWAPR